VATKKTNKISKKYQKIALFASSWGEGVGNGKKKDRKNSKKGQKVAKKAKN